MSKKTSNSSDGKLARYSISSLGIVFLMYCLVAPGAFGIEEIIPAVGPGLTLALLCAFPIIWALPISSLVSECCSLLPEEGGVYVWAREAFGEFWGFQSGWWNTVAIYVSCGTYTSLAASYVGQVLALSDVGIIVLKVAIIVFFTAVNLLGLKDVERVSDVFSIAIIVVFLVITIVGFINWQANPFTPFLASDTAGFDIGTGLSLCVWMYCGYECIATLSGEIEDKRVISRGLKLAMPLIALSYLLPTLAALGSLPQGSWELWTVESGVDGEGVGYASVLTSFLGQTGGLVFIFVAFVSQCALFNAYLASGSRGFFVLAEDRLFFPSIGKLSKKHGVPYIAVLSLAITALIFSQFEFTMLVEMEVFFILALYILLPLVVVRLRKKYPLEKREQEGSYAIGFGKPGLMCAVALPMVISVFVLASNGVWYLIGGFIAIATGPVCYVIFKRKYGGIGAGTGRFRLEEGDVKRIATLLGVAAGIVLLGLVWTLIFG